MSFFKNLFGGKKADPAPTTSDSIQKLRETENMLLKKQEFLETKLEAELKIAKENASSNKRVALQALKRKKRYEQQLEQLQGTLTTIETQREALENANTNAAVLDTMKGASDALKKTHKDMNVDNVHDMMDDIAEQNDVANEISNAISSGIISSSGVDEDELAKELEELEQEELDKDLLNVGPATNKLPEVPSTDLPTTSKDKEKKKAKPVAADDMDDDPDMKELMQWAN
ncbi:CLUMA_CG016503, isoform A [Clunio marinus]|uniref:CLUMA_CG016503, isoform A n=1 Tax=Clunio marinus TaxID=568069 RepID=A0A1J1IY33_9DIPT|nr:CLUMA_CG016503, isoform A [Clunio marinus]